MNRESVPFQQHHWQTVDDDIQSTHTSFDVVGLPTGKINYNHSTIRNFVRYIIL